MALSDITSEVEMTACISRFHLLRLFNDTARDDAACRNCEGYSIEQGPSVSFEPGHLVTEFGVSFRRSNGLVTHVVSDGMGAQLGVEAGFYFDSIDGRRYTESLLESKMNGSSNYTVRFSQTKPLRTASMQLLTVAIHRLAKEEELRSGIPASSYWQVSCTTLSGVEVGVWGLSREATVDDIAADVKCEMHWPNVQFFSSDGDRVDGCQHLLRLCELMGMQDWTLAAQKVKGFDECPACQFELLNPAEDHMHVCECGTNLVAFD